MKLKEIKNKKVKAFYEDQNARLNDWAEVDALVRHLADDILDSFNPDADHDGRREREGGILLQDGNIWEFLPEEVKNQRQNSEKNARRAININVIANIILLIAKVCVALCTVCASTRQPLIGSVGRCSILLFFPLPDRIPRRLWTRPPLHAHRLDYQPSRPVATQSPQQTLSRRTPSS